MPNILIVYIALVIVATFAEGLAALTMGTDYPVLTPFTLNDHTTMNWVGCYLTWIFLGLISPIVFIFKLFYFLFHL